MLAGLYIIAFALLVIAVINPRPNYYHKHKRETVRQARHRWRTE